MRGRRCRAAVDLRRAREGAFASGYDLLDRSINPCQIYWNEQQCQRVNAQKIPPLVAASGQIPAVEQIVGSCRNWKPDVGKLATERNYEEQEEADVRKRGREQVMRADQCLGSACAHRTAAGPEFEQAREDNQTTIGPPPSLDHKSPKIRRGRAVSQSLRMIVQTPAARHEIDGRPRVFDQGLVLDEDRNLMTALFGKSPDLVDRCETKNGIGANPERRVIRSEALVDQVLNIGGRASHTLQHRRRVRIGGIRTLGNGD